MLQCEQCEWQHYMSPTIACRHNASHALVMRNEPQLYWWPIGITRNVEDAMPKELDNVMAKCLWSCNMLSEWGDIAHHA